MIAKTVDCTVNEVHEHIGYLRGTPVCGLAGGLSRQEYILKKAEIDSVSYLGSMRTEFGQLGPFTSAALFGADKFLVRQVLSTLRDIQSPDVGSAQTLEGIERFMAMNASGMLEAKLRITVLVEDAGYIIKDGCKRAVAFYEKWRSLESDGTVFPIYLLIPNR